MNEVSAERTIRLQVFRISMTDDLDIVLRFAGDHDRLLETAAGIRESLGWPPAA